MGKLSQFTKVRLLVVLAHVVGVWGLINYWDQRWLLLTLVCHICFLWLGNEMYVHRFLSHKAFLMPLWLQRVCAYFSVFNLFGTPIGIAATHVTHHKYSDREGDPHPAYDPIRSWLWIHPRIDKSNNRSTVKRLMRDEWLVMISRHYFFIYLGTVISLALLDIRIAIYGFCVHVMYAFFCDGLINVVCHRHGYKQAPTTDNSRNNLLVNALLLFSGAALHNTHHARPNATRLDTRWYEVDLVGVIIDLVRIKRKTV